MIKTFLQDETASTAVEYGIIAGVLSTLVIGGIGYALGSVEWLFTDSNSKVTIAFK